MAVIVKICGLSTPDTLDAALAAGADMVGFVFFPASPRHVSLEMARALAEAARGRAEIAALTVDADDATLGAIVEAVRPDWLQLHGGETPARLDAVASRFGVPLMKAVGVATRADLESARDYAAAARLLFDARPPKDATRPGGLGRAFDWSLLDGITPPQPFLVSGGLDATNVAAALASTRAHGVDVSSGVERAPGVKDARMIFDFVRAARLALPHPVDGERSARSVG